MGGRGPAPKSNPRRTNEHPSEKLEGTTRVDVPPLANRGDYGPDTLRWWTTWVTSPQSEAFLPTDFERLQMLAPLVEQFWTTGDKNILSEIRLNEERLGATLRDRQSLRMTISPKEPAKPSQASSGPSENVVRLRGAFGGK
jgi:hypothetical protein